MGGGGGEEKEEGGGAGIEFRPAYLEEDALPLAPGAWRYKVSDGTGRFGVSIL